MQVVGLVVTIAAPGLGGPTVRSEAPRVLGDRGGGPEPGLAATFARRCRTLPPFLSPPACLSVHSSIHPSVHLSSHSFHTDLLLSAVCLAQGTSGEPAGPSLTGSSSPAALREQFCLFWDLLQGGNSYTVSLSLLEAELRWPGHAGSGSYPPPRSPLLPSPPTLLGGLRGDPEAPAWNWTPSLPS